MAGSSADSSTGRYLAPTSPPPADDLDLDVQLQGIIAGLTGLPDTNVFPRWQPVAPRLPNIDETWVAVGATDETPFDTLALTHNGAGDGSSTLTSTYRVEVLASFYGPRGNAYARLVADGLWVSQNREGMLRQGIALRDVGPLRRVPVIANTGSQRRTDLALTFLRVVARTLPIRNVAQAIGTIVAADVGPTSPSVSTEPFATTEP